MQTIKEQDTNFLIGLEVINVLKGNVSKSEMHMQQSAFDLITDMQREICFYTCASKLHVHNSKTVNRQ